ncbi:MAG: glycosyl transferase family 1, partial [Prochloraceae cyanobacterium]
MTHFGVICPVSSGHLNTMLPLTKELQKRGHRLSFIGLPNAAEKIAAAGLEFCPIEPEDYTEESR